MTNSNKFLTRIKMSLYGYVTYLIYLVVEGEKITSPDKIGANVVKIILINLRSHHHKGHTFMHIPPGNVGDFKCYEVLSGVLCD